METNSKKRSYDRWIWNYYLPCSVLVFIGVVLIWPKFDINLVANLYLGISLLFVGILSYKYELMGGFPDFINHYIKGSTAKIQGIIAIIGGVIFIYLGIRQYI